MSITVKFNRKLKNLMDVNSRQGLIPKVREEFSKKGPIKVKQAIIQDMIKGVSPVKGKRWGKYSKSYKDVIEGKKKFRTFGGKVNVTNGPDRDFLSKSKPTKAISPVNLRHTGDLHKSLKTYTKSGFLRGYRLIVEFKSKIAVYHNKLGAGKSKKIRRMLPTKTGESFNRKITTVLLTQLKIAAEKVAKQFTGQ